MPEPNLLPELFELSLGSNEIAFMYLGYAGVILRMTGGTVAIDVSTLLKGKEIEALEDLDLLLFTHNHWDHYAPDTALRICEATDAHIVAQQLVADDLKGKVPLNKLTSAKPRLILSIGDFEIVAVDGVHPRPISLYRIKKGETSISIGGDSGYVPVKEYPADIAFLPTGRPSPTCSPENALRFTLDLNPKVAVAMHGTVSQMNKYKKIVEKEMPDATVIIPKTGKPMKLTL